MRIIRMTGGVQPELVRYSIKLGLRQYTIAFDVQKSGNNEQEMYNWSEVTFDIGKPTYSQLTAAIIQSRYPQDDMQAIINNHLLEDDNVEHQKEWVEMQEWRVEAKKIAKKILAQL